MVVVQVDVVGKAEAVKVVREAGDWAVELEVVGMEVVASVPEG